MNRFSSSSIEKIYQTALSTSPFRYQTALAEQGLPDMLEAPTGTGKTAAVVLAWVFRRFFHPDQSVRASTPARFVLAEPTRALTDQSVTKIRGWLENLGLTDEVPLIQLMGGTLRNQSGDDWRTRVATGGLIVGTIDCIASRTLVRGYGCSRSTYPIDFALLTNDCQIVVDETQLCRQATHTLRQVAGFRNQNNPQGVGTFQLTCMSATIEPSDVQTIDNPDVDQTHTYSDLILNDEALTARREAGRMVQKATAKTAKELAALAVENHAPGTLTLVVVNTVAVAQNVAKDLLRLAGDTQVTLVHSRFRPLERAEIIKKIEATDAENSQGGIVVSTQVLEAGLDLNATTMITEVAPWSSLTQRFGRCNRNGELPAGNVFWVPPFKPKKQPYDPGELATAEALLETLEGQRVTSATMKSTKPPEPDRIIRTIRHRDFLDLFDTSADLSGRDLDVSGYIRERESLDVYFVWSQDLSPVKSPDKSLWCPVSLTVATQFLKKLEAKAAQTYDTGKQAWLPANSVRLTPGQLVMLCPEAGGYDAALGFTDTGKKLAKDVQLTMPTMSEEKPAPSEPNDDGHESDPLSQAKEWVTLQQHSSDARACAEQLVSETSTNLAEAEKSAVTISAWAHDIGKAFTPWQQALVAAAEGSGSPPRQGVLYAKSAQGEKRTPLRYEKNPGFRHELISALVLMDPFGQEWLSSHGVPVELHNLCAYLVGAHHGKLRLRLTNPAHDESKTETLLGLSEGETLQVYIPTSKEITTHMQFDMQSLKDPITGWESTALELFDHYGPFKLAYLETLVRLADWQASQ